MSSIGYFSLLVAFILSGYTVVVSLLSIRKKDALLLTGAERAVNVVFVLVTMAAVALLSLLLSHNFQIRYVAEYSNRSMPVLYVISAFWAGQAGSLLLWVWLLGIMGAVLVYQNRNKNRELLPYALSVVSITTFFFLWLTLFKTNPFELNLQTPADGRGMNPLLQNPEMIFHPPSLYVGFVGLTIPFAFAIAALASGNLSDQWIKTTRHWTLFAWLFLTIGNILGAQWAYVELGWGGYWAWDPVENASLLPWLTATAFLHTVIVQERRGMMKIWNMVLIVFSFALTIFGTFVTRSGLISSVHAFGVSDLGPLFLVFLSLILIISSWLIFRRLAMLTSKRQITSWTSKESSFLINNIIFLALAFIVFAGTLLPTISEALTGEKIAVGPSFFNYVSAPLGLLLLLVTGLCTLLAWRKTTGQRLFRLVATPAISAVVVSIILIIAGINHGKALLAFALVTFVLIIIISEFYRGIRARQKSTNDNILTAFWQLVTKNRRRYGGLVVHTGVVLMFLGITGSSTFQTEKTAVLKSGQAMVIGNYKLTFKEIVTIEEPHFTRYGAVVEVENSGKNVGRMVSEKHVHPNYDPVTEVAIRSTLSEDLYVIFAGFENDQLTLSVLINPLVIWMWIGGIIMSLGTVLLLIPGNRKKSVEVYTNN